VKAGIERGRTKRFSAEQFCRMQRAASFVGAVAFWRQLVELTPTLDWRVSIRATRLLEQFAKVAYDDCQGVPFSPQEAECFQFLGLEPLGVREPGACAVKEEDRRGCCKPCGDAGTSGSTRRGRQLVLLM
jgi:hypothetical protein